MGAGGEIISLIWVFAVCLLLCACSKECDCGCEFCWLCMKEISDLHYLSPSGCTFWGKKPWSRKKKILWQLGTLVGAPVGIALIAGIAIPAMIIGIPVYVGRKVKCLTPC